MLFQHFEGLLGGVALGDAAEIEAHAGDPQLPGPGHGVKIDRLVADPLLSLAQPMGCGQGLEPSCSTPQSHQGTDADVEGAPAALRHLLCQLEDVIEVVAERHRFAGFATTESIQLALRQIVAQTAVQGLDAPEGRPRRGPRPVAVACTMLDANSKTRPHVLLGEVAALERRGTRRQEQHQRHQQPDEEASSSGLGFFGGFGVVSCANHQPCLRSP